MRYLRKSTSICLAVVLFLFCLPSPAQRGIGDSVIESHSVPLEYDFVFNYFSQQDGPSTTKGSCFVSGSVNKKFRLKMDSETDRKSNYEISLEYIGNSEFNGCNDLKNKTYEDLSRDKNVFDARVGLYMPDHIFSPDNFLKYFKGDKRFILKSVLVGDRYILTILDTNEIDGLAITKRSTIKYEVNKENYRVLRYFFSSEYELNKITFRDSCEIIFSYRNKPGTEIDKYIDSFRPFKTLEKKPEIDPQDTVSVFPQYILPTLNGKKYDSKDAKSRYTLVEFWYKSCLPCLRNIERLKTLRDSLKGFDLEVVAINDTDPFDDNLASFIQKFHTNYILLFNGNKLSKDLLINAHPITYIYDNKSRKILFYRKGTSETYADEIINFVNSL